VVSPSTADGGAGTPADHSDGHSAAPPLVLQAVVDSKLYLIDVSAFIRTFEQDGNFSLEQLNRLSDNAPDSIPSLLEKWPHVVNFRDEESGDTVLHHCARTSREKIPASVIEGWLSGSVAYLPLCNKEGQTALHTAVENQRPRTAKALIRGLDPKLRLSGAICLTQDLVAIAQKWPADLVDLILMLGGSDGGFSIFYKQRQVLELTQELDDFDVRGSPDGSGQEDWDGYEGEEADINCSSVLQVLVLRDFAAAPTADQFPPYTALVRAAQANSDLQLNSLMRTKLMRTVTRFKWNTYVRQRVIARLCKYVAHFVLAMVALMVSAHTTDQQEDFKSNGGWSNSDSWSDVNAGMLADVLVAMLGVTNSLVVRQEWRQRGLTSIGDYLQEGWNQIDLAGIITLYAACAAHFLDGHFVLSQIGGAGILLNALSFLKLLQPFSSTGTMIKVLVNTASSPDVLGFVKVMLVLIFGFGMAFAVSMPTNDAFYTTNGTIFPGLLTTTMAMAQDFDIDQYHGFVPMAMFLLFLYLVIIVMFNVLIAIVSTLFDNVMETADVEVDQQRADAIIDEEALMSDADRSNAEYFPHYIEILQRESGEQNAEHVTSRQVQEDVAEMKAEMKLEVAELRAELRLQNEKSAAQNEKMLEMMSTLLAQQPKPSSPANGPSKFHSVVGQVMAQSRADQKEW
jgi:hypothetical protein